MSTVADTWCNLIGWLTGKKEVVKPDTTKADDYYTGVGTRTKSTFSVTRSLERRKNKPFRAHGSP